MYFCIRDDDTSFFTQPVDLEQAYGGIKEKAPVSLAIVPFCRAGVSKGVPERFRKQWSVHPLHENAELVSYLRQEIAAGRFEAMLHGYYHDEHHGAPEFAGAPDLEKRVLDGRKYLQDLLQTRVDVFVPPHNCIRRQGLRAIERAGLHLGGVAGVRSGWPLLSLRTWQTWARLRRWTSEGGKGIPWVLDMGGHKELPGCAITPLSIHEENEAAFDSALSVGGVFCAATHYWEFDVPSRIPKQPSVREQLQLLVGRALADSRIVAQTMGEIVMQNAN